jgi:hypothetical protein
VPVNSTRADCDAAHPGWIRARDLLAGEDAVKAAGVKYLPRLEAQTDEEYEAYKSRACFFNATRRAAGAFVGLVFRKAPFVRIPEGEPWGPGRGVVMGFFGAIDLPRDLPRSLISWQIVAGACIALLWRRRNEEVQNSLYLQAIMHFSQQKKVVGWLGLEPRTNGLKGRCSTD